MKKIKEKVKNIRNSKGITLIALIITIIILLILAGISIQALTNTGLFGKATEAKVKTEIAEETEMLKLAIMDAMSGDRYGSLTKESLQKSLDDLIGEGKSEVTEEEEEGIFFVKFIESGRVYQVSENGEVTYLGEETDLLGQAEIGASPESNAIPQLVQQAEITVKTPLSIEDENITLVYAWNQSESEEPETSKYVKATTTTTGRTRTATISSNDTAEGNYYLWVKAIIEENEILKCFGPYAIKDHTTLISCNTERESTSGFLGNTNIARNLIEKVTIETSLGTHTTSDENCWDVSQSQNGRYLAWYEDSDSDGYPEVTIAGEGGVVANSDSSYLFAYVGYGLEDEVKIEGLENLDTGLVTSMQYMFGNCKNTVTLDVRNWDTSNVTLMGNMFYGCKNLASIDLSKFDTTNVTSMCCMFNGCNVLENINVSNWNTGNVTNMAAMFKGCNHLKEINLTNFDVSNVEDMTGMFSACNSLKTIDASNFTTNNVMRMNSMFSDCKSLVSVDLSNFETEKLESVTYMFYGCGSLEELKINKFDMANVTAYEGMIGNVPSTLKITTNSSTGDWLQEKFPDITFTLNIVDAE